MQIQALLIEGNQDIYRLGDSPHSRVFHSHPIKVMTTPYPGVVVLVSKNVVSPAGESFRQQKTHRLHALTGFAAHHKIDIYWHCFISPYVIRSDERYNNPSVLSVEQVIVKHLQSEFVFEFLVNQSLAKAFGRLVPY